MALKPGYKQTDVGSLPEDWHIECIETLANITTGSRNTQDRVEDGQYPFFVRSQTVERINSYSFDGEAVLTAGDGVGTGKVFHYINGRFDVHQRVYRISQFDSRLNGLFFYLYFSTHFYNRIMQMTAKSSVDSVRRDMIARMLVPVPSPAEQKAIAGALSDVGGLIGALDQLIAKKRDLKQAAMQQLLIGRTRLPGFKGKWKLTRLGNHVTYLSHATHARAVLLTEGSIRYLHYGDVHAAPSIWLDPGTTPMPFVPERLAARFDRLESGDLVFVDASEDLTGIGKSVELRGAEGMEIISGLHTITARFDKSILADGFKGYLQFIPSFKAQLKRLAAGTKVYASNRSHVSSVEIELPGVDEQVAIAEALNEMAAEISSLETRREKTKLLKTGMMQELLTGRTRLAKAEAVPC